MTARRSLDNCCTKFVWLDAGAWLSLACAPFRSARASTCARLVSAASRWSRNSVLFHTGLQIGLRCSTPCCLIASVSSSEQADAVR